MTTATLCAAGGSSLAHDPSRILVATVDESSTARLREQLERFGFVVAAAGTDAAQLVHTCRGCRPDLAIIDLNIRAQDGKPAARSVAAQAGVPVVALSRTCDPSDAEDARDAGALALLLEPAEPAQLRAAITVAWGRYVEATAQEAEIDRLKQRLEDRRIIEQAKWALVQRLGVSEPEAFKTMQRRARDSRRTLTVVARSILDTTEVLEAVRATG